MQMFNWKAGLSKLGAGLLTASLVSRLLRSPFMLNKHMQIRVKLMDVLLAQTVT
jgi:hypothetical protein